MQINCWNRFGSGRRSAARERLYNLESETTQNCCNISFETGKMEGEEHEEGVGGERGGNSNIK